MLHRGTLNEVALQYGLPLLEGSMDPRTYLGYVADLMLVRAGQLSPDTLAEYMTGKSRKSRKSRKHPYSEMGKGT